MEKRTDQDAKRSINSDQSAMTEVPKKIKKSSKKRSKPLRKKRWWLYPFTFIFNASLTIILLLLVGVGFLLMTNSGLNVTVSLVNKYLSDYVVIGSANGKLLSEVEFKDVAIKLDETQQFQFGSVGLKWNPWALLYKKVDVDYLVADRGRILFQAPDKEEEILENDEPFSLETLLTSINIPLSIDLNRVDIDDFKMLINNEIYIDLQSLSSGHFSFKNDQVVIDQSIDLAGRLYLDKQKINLPLTASLSGEADLSALTLDLLLNASSEQIVLDKQSLGAIVGIHLSGELNNANLTLNSTIDFDQYLTDALTLNVEANLIDQQQLIGDIHLSNLDNQIDLNMDLSYLSSITGALLLNIDAQNLKLIHPTIAGVLTGDIAFNGELYLPTELNDLIESITKSNIVAESNLTLSQFAFYVEEDDATEDDQFHQESKAEIKRFRDEVTESKQSNGVDSTNSLQQEGDASGQTPAIKIERVTVQRAPTTMPSPKMMPLSAKKLSTDAGLIKKAAIDSMSLVARYNEEKMIEAKVGLNNLSAGDLTIDSITLDSKGSLDDYFKGELIVNRLKSGDEIYLDRATSHVEGSLIDHKFDLLVESPYGQVDLGGLARLSELVSNPKWTLYIDKGRVDSSMTGLYQLQEPTYFFASQKEIMLSSFCLLNRPVSLCVEGKYEDSGVVGYAVLRHLPSSLLTPFLPKELTIDTSLDMVVNGQYIDQTNFVGVADISLARGKSSYQLQGREVEVPLTSTFLRLLARPDNVTTELNIDWGDYLQVTGKGSIESLFDNPQIIMSANANIPTLAWIRPIVPFLQKFDGKLTAKAGLSGSLLKPTLDAEVGFNDGNIYIGDLNSSLKNIQLNAKLEKGAPVLKLKGQTDLGSGRLKLDGDFNIKQLSANVHLYGDNLLLADSDNIHVLASTDIVYKLKEMRHSVKGNLLLPEIKYLHADFGASRGKVKAISPDLVIVSHEGDEKQEVMMDNLELDFTVRLGRDVSVGMGSFLGKLRGGIKLEKEFNKDIQALGGVDIEGGEYRLYDQLLSLDRGRVQFSGPLMNPLLDIQASREVDMGRSNRKGKVGIRISGNLRRPKLELYANPDMPDLSIVSYLVFGREPNFDSPVENIKLVDTMRKILSGQDPGGGGLADSVGLTDLGLMQDMDGNTSIGLGKQINDHLYIGFGMSIEESNAYATLRYRFLKYFNFESQFGSEDTSADVLYTRDF